MSHTAFCNLLPFPGPTCPAKDSGQAGGTGQRCWSPILPGHSVISGPGGFTGCVFLPTCSFCGIVQAPQPDMLPAGHTSSTAGVHQSCSQGHAGPDPSGTSSSGSTCLQAWPSGHLGQRRLCLLSLQERFFLPAGPACCFGIPV